MRYQSVTTGLYPSSSAEKEIGTVRDTLYCCTATFALHQAYKRIDNDQGKCYELGQSTVLSLQGILSCWMRQSAKIERFKIKQNLNDALHVKFDLATGFEGTLLFYGQFTVWKFHDFSITQTLREIKFGDS